MQEPRGRAARNWPPVNRYYGPARMAVELGLGAAAFFASLYLFVLRITPQLVSGDIPRGRLNLAFLFLVPFGLNIWRFMAHMRRAGPSNAAFALMLNWIGYVAGMSLQFLVANARYLM